MPFLPSRPKLKPARMETPAREPAHWYHPELDILRFGAFSMVFIFHAMGGDFRSRYYSAGAYGVDLFFALSAYLITEILLREHRTYGSFNIRAFYLRRILRIWPLYFAFLILTFLFAQPIFRTEDFPLSAKVMFLLFVGNLSWPLLLRRWMSKLPWIGAGLLLFGTSYRFLLYLHGPVARPVDTYWKGTFSHLDPIVMGSLAAFYLRGRIPQLTRIVRLSLGIGGILGILAAGWFGPPYGGRALLTYPAAAVSCVAILIAVLRPMRPERPRKVRTALIHLGRISYGLYVFHGACLSFSLRLPLRGSAGLEWFTRRSAGFLLTILVAECSYRVLELPFLRLKDRFSAVKTAPVTAASKESNLGCDSFFPFSSTSSSPSTGSTTDSTCSINS